MNDERFENGLVQHNFNLLADECYKRIVEVKSADSFLSFRLGFNGPVCWRWPDESKVAYVPEAWGREAAKALLDKMPKPGSYAWSLWLMGRLVEVSRILVRETERTIIGKHYSHNEELVGDTLPLEKVKRVWKAKVVSPRVGWVVGMRHLQNGYVDHDVEYIPYLRVTDTTVVLLVSYWPTVQPVKVPLDGFWLLPKDEKNRVPVSPAMFSVAQTIRS